MSNESFVFAQSAGAELYGPDPNGEASSEARRQKCRPGFSCAVGEGPAWTGGRALPKLLTALNGKNLRRSLYASFRFRAQAVAGTGLGSLLSLL